MDFLNDLVQRFILFISSLGETFWEHLTLSQYSFWQTAIDILIVACIFYWLIMALRGTRGVHILTGLLLLAFIYYVSDRLELLAVSWILDRAFPAILVAIPIIFQEELRRGLERLGKTSLFPSHVEATDQIISDLVETSEELAKHRHGALIVLQKDIKLQDYIETGEPLDSLISKEILLSIFNPKSPLHDGAVIIHNERISAASCVLPHTFREAEKGLGTRHKAAMGLSENSDAEVIVVSEERKIISYAKEGNLQEVSPEELQKNLKKFFKTKKK